MGNIVQRDNSRRRVRKQAGAWQRHRHVGQRIRQHLPWTTMLHWQVYLFSTRARMSLGTTYYVFTMYRCPVPTQTRPLCRRVYSRANIEGGRVHYARAPAEASYNRWQSLAL